MTVLFMKFMPGKITIVRLLVGGVCFLFANALNGELIRNGEFEDTAAIAADWKSTGVAVSSSPHSANGSYSLECRLPGSSGIISQEIIVNKPLDAVVEFFGRFQAEGKIFVEVSIISASQKQVLWSSGKEDIPANDWKAVQLTREIKIAGKAELVIALSGQGKVRIDDMAIIPKSGITLIKDGSFTDGKSPAGIEWTLGNDNKTRKGFLAEIISNGGRTDGNCLKITIKRPNGLNIFYPSLKLKVKPDTQYRYSVWMKGGGLPLKINAQALEYRKMYAASCVELQELDGWKQICVDFRTPADCEVIMLNLLRLCGDASSPAIDAEIFIDDMELRENFVTDNSAVSRTRPVTLKIDSRKSTPYKNINFGVNEGPMSLGLSDCEISGGKYMMRYDNPELAKIIKELGIQSLRWGGTVLNWWDWQNDWMFDLATKLNIHEKHEGSIGRKVRYANQSVRQYGQAKTWFNEYLDLCRKNNITPLICLNVDNDTVESNEKLVKHLIAKGYKNLDLELGNELHGEKYIKDTQAFAEMVRKTSPASMIGTTEDHDAMAGAMEKAGWHDAWIPHYYYSEPYLGIMDLSRHAFTDSEYMMKSIYRRHQKYHPGTQMWLTEWGWTPFRGFSREKSLLAALWCADVLMQQLDYSDVLRYSIYHDLFDVYFGILNYDDQGRFIRSVSFFSQKMFYNTAREIKNLSEVKIDNMPLVYSYPNGDQHARQDKIDGNIPGLVVKSAIAADGSHRIMILNRTKDAMNVDILIDGVNVEKIKKMEQLCGSSIEDLAKVNGPTTNRDYLYFAVKMPVNMRETIKPAISSNIHGKQLKIPPFSFTIITPEIR